jgi:hypothetical protein
MKPAKHAIARPLRGRAMACFADTNWALRTPTFDFRVHPPFGANVFLTRSREVAKNAKNAKNAKKSEFRRRRDFLQQKRGKAFTSFFLCVLRGFA